MITINLKLKELKEMSDYLPAGSENDPNAPWNMGEPVCRYCDEELIKQISMQLAEGLNRDPDDLEQEFLDNAEICKDCYKEQEADDDDDWINWRD